MSARELRRGELLSRVQRGEMKLVEAGERLELSYRQTKRLYKHYREGGTAALKHGNAGRHSNRSKSEQWFSWCSDCRVSSGNTVSRATARSKTSVVTR